MSKVNKSLKVDVSVSEMIDIISSHLEITPHLYMNKVISNQAKIDFDKYNLTFITPYYLPGEQCEKTGWYGEYMYFSGFTSAIGKPPSFKMLREMKNSTKHNAEDKKGAKKVFSGHSIFVREGEVFPAFSDYLFQKYELMSNMDEVEPAEILTWK